MQGWAGQGRTGKGNTGLGRAGQDRHIADRKSLPLEVRALAHHHVLSCIYQFLEVFFTTNH